jgi:Na+-transporting methylmalonyl-CoA/oxaloacetate decarboxylase gamma subunit
MDTGFLLLAAGFILGLVGIGCVLLFLLLKP